MPITTFGQRDLCVFDQPSLICPFFKELWLKEAKEAQSRQGFFSVALSGGMTPKEVYKDLSFLSSKSLWQKTHIFFADERFVPADHEDSNYRMISKVLLNQISLPKENIHPVLYLKTNTISAQAYEQDIRDFFKIGINQLPRFDLIVLGVGEDGHTASLFPNDLLSEESSAIARAVDFRKAQHPRVSLTLPVLNSAGKIIFLVTGSRKAKVIKEIIEQPDSHLPAAQVRPQAGNPLFLLDKESAAFIRVCGS